VTGSIARRHFAPVGRDLARIGLGTVRFGHAGRDALFAVLDAWVDLGGDLVDTCAIYGAGESERVLGAWMTARGCRDGWGVGWASRCGASRRC